MPLKLGWILTLSFGIIASFVALVGYLFSVTSDSVQFETAKLRRSSIVEVIGAAEMRLALQSSQVAAQQIIAERYRELAEPDHETGPVLGLKESIEVVDDSLDEFEKRLRSSWEATRAVSAIVQKRGEMERANVEREAAEEWLIKLEKELAVHKTLMDRFIHLADYHPSDQVSEFLLQDLEPHYRDQMLPLIRAYEKDAEAELAGQLSAMESAHEAANRRNIIVTIIAFLSAIGLGLLISSSISRPLASLKDAALRVGRGELETRIHLKARNEIGVLAQAFNKMVGDLQASTVSRSYLDNIIQSMEDMLIVTDPSGTIQTVNRVALRELGYREEELIGQLVSTLLSDEPEATLASGEHRVVTKDGRAIPVYCSRSEMGTESGDPEGFVYVAQDISERKQTEARLLASLREKEVLLKEVHHRVKNNLQIISSLLSLQGRETDHPRAGRSLRESRNRIRSMALIHEQLYQSEDLANIDFAQYVERLVDYVVSSYGRDGLGVSVQLRIESTSLSIDYAIPCGMIVNELVANAVEHAFPDGQGEILIEFCSENNHHTLAVSDNGKGLPPSLDPAQAKSLGLRLIAALVEQLGGELEVASSQGTRVTVAFSSSPVEEELQLRT
jgi:PAS domain S-box-containing protein